MSKLKLFGNFGDEPKTMRAALQSKYSAARTNLLMVVAFTAINILMLAFGGGSYFLFSATVPYLITLYGMLLCGMLPEEVYEGMEGMFFLDESFFYITLVISAAILALYVICFFFSKKKPVFLTIGLVIFAIDTLVMVLYYGISADMIMDAIFHAWVLWILFSGVKANSELKKIPDEEPAIEAEFRDVTEEESYDGDKELEDSPILRHVDPMAKARILMREEINGHTVEYRRVKRTNELAIDGKVYAEYIALAEQPHKLRARVGGHVYAVGTNAQSQIFVSVDENVIKTKLRLI